MGAALRYLGTALALIFIGAILLRSLEELPSVDFASGSVWAALAAGAFFYVLSQISGALAWHTTLRIYDVELPWMRTGSQLLVSQIGKYIPGNVAHLLGRFALARADSVPAAIIGGALLLEVGILLTVGVLIVGSLLLILPDFIQAITAELSGATASASAFAILSLLVVGVVVGQILIWRKAGKPRLRATRFIAPALLFCCNFFLLGVSLWSITHAVSPNNAPGILHATAIFTTAWVAGFLMPGAPGGVGVRDGIIALGLELFIGQGAGLGVAILHRIISILGDVAAFGLGLALRRTQSVSEPG